VIARRIALAAAVAALCACPAAAADRNWASAEIRAVTSVGVLGESPATFRPQAPLTQEALAQAIAAADAVRNADAPPPEQPIVLSTVADGAVVTGDVALEIDVANATVDHIDLAVDGLAAGTAAGGTALFDLDASRLADGEHRVTAEAALATGGTIVAEWSVLVANQEGAVPTAPGPPVAVPVVKAPAAPAPRRLYRAVAPTRAVTVKSLDAALVGYLDLGDAARAIQRTLAGAGLRPPANTGTEAVARMLGLRLNHPAADDGLELLPLQPVTRAEAAYSFAQVLRLDGAAAAAVREAALSFRLPALTPWQQRVLQTAVHFVGYPYVWGGTSPTAQTLFGVRSAGGFDCSGFVWRVYKLTRYPGGGRLPDVLRGRTTYEMSGEVPRTQRIAAADLQPGDVMFFGARGPRSRPAEVDHAALYLGGGWLAQSSGEGVTLVPFGGWYARTFAWARRPLGEAGL